MSWSKIPMALRIAALSTIGIAILLLAMHPFPSIAVTPRFWMFRVGLGYAAKGFAIYGTLELAGLLRARAAIGAKLAAAGWAATILIGCIEVGVSVAGAWRDPIGVTLQWVWWVAMLAVGVGFAIAAFRRPVIAIAGAVVWLVINRPPLLEEWVWKHTLDHPYAQMAVSTAGFVLQAAVVLVLAAVAVGNVPAGFVVRDPQRIRWGHTRIANALWLRVIAISALPVVTLMIMGSQNSASFKAIGYTMIAAGGVNAVSFLLAGLGMLDAARANVAELRRTPFYLGAAATLWCGGVTLYQLPELYQSIFGDRSGFLAERSADTASAFTIVLPLVAAAGIVLWTTGVGGLALRRERLDLSERATRTAMWFVALSGAGLGVTQGLLPEARSDSSALLLLLLALACGLVAIVNAARLARDTAELGNIEQATLPTATML